MLIPVVTLHKSAEAVNTERHSYESVRASENVETGVYREPRSERPKSTARASATQNGTEAGQPAPTCSPAIRIERRTPLRLHEQNAHLVEREDSRISTGGSESTGAGYTSLVKVDTTCADLPALTMTSRTTIMLKKKHRIPADADKGAGTVPASARQYGSRTHSLVCAEVVVARVPLPPNQMCARVARMIEGRVIWIGGTQNKDFVALNVGSRLRRLDCGPRRVKFELRRYQRKLGRIPVGDQVDKQPG
ncbi:hypothetical protein CERSUDRAFT_126652 [Gelatoporia subvermispora B]|uniref:Uncharacterized protein n=1 Tax=Ceriporiopsis subvermispora (strain B) TaxID=914234 RepID=M2QK82_CERS8|nr:hypothetical protein CERSUDRAFT_126652 [Gelatoporia subvermispora B]